MEKRWYESKGMWGGIIAGAAAIAGLFGLNVPADVQADLVNWVVGVGGLVGSALAIWGRISAQGPIR